MATGDEGVKIAGNRIGDWFRELDQLLRGELTRLSSLRRGGIAISPRRLSYVIIALAIAYGACMGTFALFRQEGPGVWQVVASMLKVPLLFFLTLLVTMPSLYVFNALVGSRLTPAAVLRLLVASLCGDGRGAGVARADRCLFLVEHHELSVHGAFQRRRIRSFRRAWADVLASDAASAERARSGDGTRAWCGSRSPGRRMSPAALLDPLEGRVLGKHVKMVFQVLGVRVCRGGRADGLGAASLHRPPQRTVRLVARPRVQFLPGCPRAYSQALFLTGSREAHLAQPASGGIHPRQSLFLTDNPEALS